MSTDPITEPPDPITEPITSRLQLEESVALAIEAACATLYPALDEATDDALMRMALRILAKLEAEEHDLAESYAMACTLRAIRHRFHVREQHHLAEAVTAFRRALQVAR